MNGLSPWGLVTLGILAAFVAAVALIIVFIIRRKRQQERDTAEAARKRAELERNRANARRMYDDLDPRARKRKVAVLQQDGTPILAERSYSRKMRRTATHSHSYSGGTWNGEYYPPGYYSDPFWTYLIVAGMLDSDAGNSDSHDSSPSTQWWGDSDGSSSPEPTPVPTSTPSSSGDDWGSSSSDSGYDSSSYDSGGWSGGSFDSGSSGGGDSGGGGGGD